MQQILRNVGAVCAAHKQVALAGTGFAAAGLAWAAVRHLRGRRAHSTTTTTTSAAAAKVPKAQRALLARHAGDDAGKVHLYTSPQWMLSPSLSPYGVRLEVFLRLAEIPYERHATLNLGASPNGCVPFIVYNGRCIADSRYIMDELSTAFQVKMDEGLTEKQQAVAKCIRATMDYRILPSVLRSIFLGDPKGRELPFVAAALGIPQFLRWPLGMLLRRVLTAQLRANGQITISEEQYVHMLLEDFKMLESVLGDQLFFFGNKPTTTDCVVYGVLLHVFRLFFLTNTHPPRQSFPICTGSHGKPARLSADEVFINEAMQYLIDSISLNNFIQRMTERVFPQLDTTLAPCSPTRVQRDIKVLAEQAEHIKRRVEQLSTTPDDTPNHLSRVGRSISRPLS